MDISGIFKGKSRTKGKHCKPDGKTKTHKGRKIRVAKKLIKRNNPKSESEEKGVYAVLEIKHKRCANCFKKKKDQLPATHFIPWLRCPKCKGQKFWFDGLGPGESPYIIYLERKTGEKIAIVKNRKALKEVRREHPEMVVYAWSEMPQLARMAGLSRDRVHEIKEIFGGGVLKVTKHKKCKDCKGYVKAGELVNGSCKECSV